MRLNKNHSKKHIIGSFKFPYSLNGSNDNKPKWVNETETKEIEQLIGFLFINYLRKVENRKVQHFSPNKNDENKNPDIFIHLDGKLQSAQITQIRLNDYLTKFNETKNLCNKLSKLITEIYKPPLKINIQIYPPWEAEEPIRSKHKIHKRIAKVIALSLSENIDKLSTNNEFLNFDLDKSIFRDFADSYNFYPIPDNCKSNYFGENNVYIDYEFDDIKISEEDIINAVNKVYTDKNNGHSQILIIWGDQNQFMGTESKIYNQIQKKFINSSFESIYFLFFYNTLDIEIRTISCWKIE